MFYHFIYLAKGFRMRPKVRSTLINYFSNTDVISINFQLLLNYIIQADTIWKYGLSLGFTMTEPLSRGHLEL